VRVFFFCLLPIDGVGWGGVNWSRLATLRMQVVRYSMYRYRIYDSSGFLPVCTVAGVSHTYDVLYLYA